MKLRWLFGFISPSIAIFVACSAFAIEYNDLPVRTLGMPAVSVAAYSPNLKHAAFAHTDIVYLLLTEDWRIQRTFENHVGSVTAVTFSPDGNLVASSATDSTVRIWEIDTGHEIHSLENGHADSTTFLAFSPDGKFLAGSNENYIRLWNTSTGEVIRDIIGSASHIQFSPNGNVLAAVVSGGINLWEVTTGKLVRKLTESASCIAFSPDGSSLASAGGADDRFRLWDVESGWEILSNSGVPEAVRSIVFSPHGDLVALGIWEWQKAWGPEGLAVILWNVADGGSTERLEATSGYGRVRSLSFDKEGKRLMWVEGNCEVGCWDAITRQVLYWDHLQIGHKGSVWAVALSADGAVLASAPGSTQSTPDPTIIMWDVATGQEIHKLTGHSKDAILTLEFSRDGKLLASGTWGEEAKIWNVKTGQELFDLPHTKTVYATSFSPDGLILATGTGGYCQSGEIRLWNTSDGSEMRTLEGHSRSVQSLAFSPDGSLLASGSEDTDVKLWIVKSGWVKTLTGHSGPVVSVGFSQDGTLLYSVDIRDLILWDVETGEEVTRTTITGVYEDYYTTSAFSREGDFFGFTTRAGAVKLMHVTTGQVISLSVGGTAATGPLAINSHYKLVAFATGKQIKLQVLGIGGVLE